jgi:hypothetical protein
MMIAELMWPHEFLAKSRHCEQSEAIQTTAEVAVLGAPQRFHGVAGRARKQHAAEFVALVWIASPCSQ